MSGTFIHVIRHADAGSRRRWTGRDETRPLSDGGRHQAKHMVEVFADQPLVQLVSSPFLRCVQTLEPLADARGLSIDLRDELAEGRPWEYLEKLILEAEGDGPTAVCVHGDVFRELMSDLFERRIARRANQSFAKGATWVLEVRDGAIVSARHVPAPPTD
ncbi:MAG: phosphoglycerate mutase family protein [Actinomycetota bacterium]